MNMYKIVVAALAALLVASCTKEQMQANMDKAKATLAAINQGAKVTASAVRQAIDAACENQAAVGMASATARTILIQQTGPNTTQNIDNLDRAMEAYTSVCAAAADPGRSDLSSLLARAIAAYAAVQRAQAKAGV